MSTIAPWIVLLLTFAAAVWAAIEARRARKCAESVVPLAPASVVVQRNGGNGEE